MVVTDRYKYIINDRDMDELYDLKEDPYEMNNLIDNQNYAQVLTDMKIRLEKWRQKTNDTITRRTIRKDRMNFAKTKMDQATLFDI